MDSLVSLRKTQRTLATKAINKCNALTNKLSAWDENDVLFDLSESKPDEGAKKFITKKELLNLMGAISTQIHIINEHLITIKDLNSEIYKVCDPTKLEELSEAAEELYYKKFGEMQTCKQVTLNWERFLEHSYTRIVPISHPTKEVSSGKTESSGKKVFSLQKLTLPNFDGEDIRYWTNFWDSFIASVDSNHDFANIIKFQYLRMCVKGKAFKAISGLNVCDANYENAKTRLKDRFGQQHKIIAVHLTDLRNLECLDVTTNSLRRFYDELEFNVLSLEALGKSPDSYQGLLVPMILEHISKDVQYNIFRDLGIKEYSLEEIRNGIKKELDILEQCEITSTFSKNPVQNAQEFKLTENSTLLANSKKEFKNNYVQKQKPLKPICCVYCKAAHFSSECTKIKNVDDRIKFVKSNNLCFNCLFDHHVQDCPSKWTCRNCSKTHHTSLCKASSAAHLVQSEPQESDSVESAPVSTIDDIDHDNTQIKSALTTRSDHAQLSGNVLLKTAYIEVHANNNKTSVPVIFDDGSQSSFCSQELCNILKLKPIGHEIMSLSGFGDKNPNTVRKLDVVKLELLTDSGELMELKTLVVPNISVPMNNNIENLNSVTHLKGLKLAHPIQEKSFTVQILIGADSYYRFVGGLVIPGYPTAVQSKFGYLLSGPTAKSVKSFNINSLLLKTLKSHDSEDELLSKFWDLDTIGVRDNIEHTKKFSVEEYCDSSIKFVDNSYCANLPWRENPETLDDNYSLCLKRTRNTARCLAKDPDMLKIYSDLIQDQLNRGFIERVPDDEISLRSSSKDPSDKPSPTVYYIPHHHVKKDSATTPIRLVFDCSSHGKNTRSMNDFLEEGPALQLDISSLLIRFRLFQHAVISDLEKAFLFVKLAKCDRDATRFFWLSDPEDAESAFIMYRFTSVLFGAKPSPFILNATLLKHLQLHPGDTASKLQYSVYVDNFVTSFLKEIEARTYAEESRELMKQGGFNLRSYCSNSQDVIDYAQSESVLDPNQEPTVLGLKWNISNDRLGFKKSINTNTDVFTKREVLRNVGKIYDPLGIANPVIVPAKCLLQDIWKSKMDWDELLSNNIKKQFLIILTELSMLSQLSVPRFLKCYNCDFIEIHCFGDSSELSFATACYIKTDSDVNLLMSRSRVVPLKMTTLEKPTMPILELLAAHINARLSGHVHDSLSPVIKDIKFYYWSDSKAVLHWLHSSKKLPRFINNRIRQIKASTDLEAWSYCPSAENPADIPTRGLTYEELISCELWWKGPSWLRLAPEYWPKFSSADDDIPSCSTSNICSTCLITEIQPEIPSEPCGLLNLIDIEQFSSYSKLLKHLSLVLGFVKRFQGVPFTLNTNYTELLLLKACQDLCFAKEIKSLQNNSPNKRLPQLVNQLSLFLDEDGLLRSSGRISNSILDYEAKFPVLLPKHHYVTKLIVESYHACYLHAGVSATLSHIRQKFWIPQGRQYVRSILTRCVICRKVNGPHYNIPFAPPLPADRVKSTRPYEISGLDYTGFFKVKIANVISKVYVLLFTCAVTRHVHLEILTDMTLETFLLGFRRFTSRCSQPRILISDCGSTFECATKHLSEQGITWKFNTKRSSWMGGFFERMVALVKISLKKSVGRKLLTFAEFQTIISEVECVVNDRPLTYVGADISDLNPITPSDLFCGRKIKTLPHMEVDNELKDDPSYGQTEIQGRFTHLASVLTEFQNRWQNEYLTSLREFHHKKGSEISQVKLGEIVIISSDKPRLFWKLGIIVKLKESEDGVVRSVDLKTANGYTNRPIVKLYPLEVNNVPFALSVQTDVRQDVETVVQPQRPQRKAAIEARKKIAYLNSD